MNIASIAWTKEALAPIVSTHRESTYRSACRTARSPHDDCQGSHRRRRRRTDRQAPRRDDRKSIGLHAVGAGRSRAGRGRLRALARRARSTGRWRSCSPRTVPTAWSSRRPTRCTSTRRSNASRPSCPSLVEKPVAHTLEAGIAAVRSGRSRERAGAGRPPSPPQLDHGQGGRGHRERSARQDRRRRRARCSSTRPRTRAISTAPFAGGANPVAVRSCST